MWYDFLSIAILAYTTIRGAMKGVIWQIAAIAGLVACFVFAESISAAAGPYIKLEPPLNNWVVMIGAYLVFSFAAFSIARLLTEWLDKIHFGDFNRHLGAILGFVKGVIVVLVLTFFSVTVSESMHQVLKHSRTGRIAAIVMDRLHPVMPEKLHDSLVRYIDIHKLDDPSLGLRHTDDHHHEGAASADGSDLILPNDFEELLSKVPEDTRGEFRELLLRSLDKSEPTTRTDLLQSLIRAFQAVETREDLTSLMQTLQQPPDKLLAAVTTWLGGSAAPAASATTNTPLVFPDDDGPPPVTAAAAAPSRRDRLLQEITAEFSKYPLAQQKIRKDIEDQLAGVPEPVAVSVLEDWRADLAAARPGQAAGTVIDPDPTTKSATTLRSRIERQTARGVSVPGDEERLQ